jgi:hypothetical protein
MCLYNHVGHEMVQMALRYKPEDRGFYSRRSHLVFFLRLTPSSRTMTLGTTQPLTEMSTTGISWRVKAVTA